MHSHMSMVISGNQSAREVHLSPVEILRDTVTNTYLQKYATHNARKFAVS